MERDGTRWNVCPFCLDLLIRLNVAWSGSYTHTHFQNHGVLVARNPSTALGIVVIA